ncbi:MAG: hypothetical protein PHH65_09645 [Eubacteriales bacterium]|nr:hypothetical protein [Eubacteriales bacterium]
MTTKKKKAPKSNSVEMRARVATVYRLLLSGLRRREVIQYAREKTEWNVSDRTIDNYIRKASAEIKEVTDEELEAARGMAHKRLDTLYYKSLLINDYKTALAVQKEINELFGLKTAKIEHSGDVGVLIVDDVAETDPKNDQ